MTRGPGKRGQVSAREAAGRQRLDPSRRRLKWLVGALATAGALFVFTAGWREQLRRESARARAAIAEQEAWLRERQVELALAAEMEQRLREQPGDVETRLRLAQVRWKHQGAAAALPVLVDAPRAGGDSRIARMLADCALQTGREDQALAALGEAVGRFPQDGDLRADRAHLYSSLAWQREAEQEVRAAEALHAPGASLARANLARSRADLAGARTILETIARERGSDPEITRQLASVAEDAGQHDEALRLLGSLEGTAARPEDRLAMAAILARQPGPAPAARALELTERALAGGPSSGLSRARARFLRARCLARTGRGAEAQGELEALRREAPKLAGLAFELAGLYRAAGRTDEARALLAEHQAAQQQRSRLKRATDALRRRPDDPRAHLQMGRVCLDEGLYGRAIVEFRRALQLAPNLPGAARLLERAAAAAGPFPPVSAPRPALAR